MSRTLEIWTDEKPLEPIRVRLVRDGQAIRLEAVTADGMHWPNGSIAVLTADGLLLHGAIDPAIGLPLDGCGAVKIIP